MKKTYGNSNAFFEAVQSNRNTYKDVFSDSSHSASTSDSLELPKTSAKPRKATAKKKGTVTKKTAVLTDISNTQDIILTTKGKKKTAKKTTTAKKTANKTSKETNHIIPHFDSFDDYQLVVQSVTPIKTHVSVTTSGSDGAWDKFPTQDMLEEINKEKLQDDGPVASSPNIGSINSIKQDGVNISHPQNHSYSSPLMTRAASRLRNAQPVPVSMNTRRAKRLRERLGTSLDTSLSTSTPEAKHLKQTRAVTSPHSVMELSHIPAVLDADGELSVSMNYMSLHDSLTEARNIASPRIIITPLPLQLTANNHSISQLHESLQAMHSPAISGHIDHDNIEQPPIILLPDQSDSSVSLLSVNSTRPDDSGAPADSLRSTQNITRSSHSNSSYASSGHSALSASLFTASYREGPSGLDNILEESEEEEDEDASIPSAQNITLPSKGGIPSLTFSDDENDLADHHIDPHLAATDMSMIEEHYGSIEDLSRSLITTSLHEEFSASLIRDDNSLCSVGVNGDDNSQSSSVYDTAHSASGSYFTPSSLSELPGNTGTPASSTELSDERLSALIEDLENLKSPSVSELGFRKRERMILKECGQRKVSTWAQYMSASEMKKLTKIGEGSYGEVYRKTEADGDITIIKIVPMEGQCTVNDEPQKKFQEMRKEIQVTKELSRIGNNFINTKAIVCTQGKYPKALLDKWDEFAERKDSENDRPDYFPLDQYYSVFEFSDGGEALESYNFKSASEGLSIFLQVGWTLAIAEDVCQFEHRDLHWSNVLVAQYPEPALTYTFSSTGDKYKICSSAVKAHIIDFTLSRLNKGEEVLFCDLSEDETLFTGEGDYQFDVYRQMKDVTRNEWFKFHSVTNIFWMRYLADKLLKMKSFPSKRGTSPTVTQLKKMLIGFLERSKSYHSAVQMVFTEEIFKLRSECVETDSDCME